MTTGNDSPAASPATPQQSPELVAIVGMAALMPGAGTLEAYWRNLVEGADAITDLPHDRWDEEFYDPERADRPDRLYCRRGGFVDEHATFEPLRFGIMPAAVSEIEPDQLLALNVAAAAIDDAGGPDRLPDGDRVGVILGRGGTLSPAQARYAQRVRMSSQVVLALRELVPELDDARLDLVRAKFDERLGPYPPEGAIGLVPNLAASRVANRLNLRGPAYTLDAACASSLIAVDQAVAELTSGRLDAVLTGGVHHVHDVTFWSVFSQLRALSARGEIRPFDQAADGLLIGEGTGMVVLKRWSDAIRDGDRVYAVIRGVGVSSDGRSASMFNPASAGQVLAIRRAWAAAGLDPTAPDALGLLEAHGTGTPTGDAAELVSVGEVFGPHTGEAPHPVIGSVKSMIGHAMPAAGIAGLIKATLAVYRGVLLPTLHCDDPLPELAATRFATTSTAMPWECDGPRRAGVNAFGFGGINAHLIIEQAPEPATDRPARSRPSVTEPEQVLWLAAADAAGLAALLDGADHDVRRAGAARARTDRPAGADERCRLGIVHPTDKLLAVARKTVARGQPWRGGRDIWFSPDPLLAGGAGGAGRLAFVYPGLEAQFAPRTADIAEQFGLPDRQWSSADLGQHGTGLIEVGKLLHEALRRMGVHPDDIAGHSIGEWTAATTSGQISTAAADEFLEMFNADSVEVPGHVFAAVGAGADRVVPMLAAFPGVLLSHDNAPAQCVVNGPESQVDRLVAALRAEQVMCHKLPFRSAFHTPAFADGLASIGAALRRWEVHPTQVRVWSAILAAPFPAEPAEVGRLYARQLTEPVRFRETVAALYDAGVRVFLQLGAGQLASLISDNLRDRDHLAMAANVAHRPGLDQLRRVATALWVEGASPNLAVLDAPGTAPDAASGQAGTTGVAARRGPSVRLDLGGPLVRLGEGAAGLLGVQVPGNQSAAPAAALAALDKLAGHSSAAAELAALLADTAQSAVSVLDAAPGQPPQPAAQPDAQPDAQPAPTPGARPAPAGQPPIWRQQVRVSMQAMPYLRDHCFFVQPPDWPHPEDRWPVVPATTMVQHMMEAAEQAVPGVRAVAVHNAQFSRWLVAEPGQDVDISVWPPADGRVLVGFGRYARATVELAPDYPDDPPPAWPPDPPAERPPEIDAEEMYAERLMFHGPLFQGVTAVHALGDMHIRGEVTTPMPPGSLLDNALQLVGNWIIATQPTRTVALPVQLGHIRFFGPLPAAGTTLACHARVRTIDESKVVADIQLSHGDRIWAMIEGALDRRFDSQPRARLVERFPERYPMSLRQPEGWTMVFESWTDQVTQDLAARGVLGSAQYAEYERQPPAARKQWLLGRIAAKDAVRFRLWEDGHTEIYPIELAIGNDPNGRPRFHPRPGRGMRDCDVSLAHSAEVAVAIAHPRAPGAPPGAAGVGIDVAEITDRPESSLRFALSEAELTRLDELASDQEGRRRWFARFWAAKEATGKAEGTGLDGQPQRFAVVAACREALDVEVGDRSYRVEYREVENPAELPERTYVVAWTWGPRSQPPSHDHITSPTNRKETT